MIHDMYTPLAGAMSGNSGGHSGIGNWATGFLCFFKVRSCALLDMASFLAIIYTYD